MLNMLFSKIPFLKSCVHLNFHYFMLILPFHPNLSGLCAFLLYTPHFLPSLLPKEIVLADTGTLVQCYSEPRASAGIWQQKFLVRLVYKIGTRCFGPRDPYGATGFWDSTPWPQAALLGSGLSLHAHCTGNGALFLSCICLHYCVHVCYRQGTACVVLASNLGKAETPDHLKLVGHVSHSNFEWGDKGWEVDKPKQCQGWRPSNFGRGREV